MHALTERRCFGTIAEAAGPTVSPARESLDFPLFYLPNGSPTDIGDEMEGRIPAALPDERVLNEIVNIPRNQIALRARWKGGSVTVHLESTSPWTSPPLTSAGPLPQAECRHTAGTEGNVSIDAQQIVRIAGTISHNVLASIHARVKYVCLIAALGYCAMIRPGPK